MHQLRATADVQEILDNIGVPILAVDLQGRVAEWNRAATGFTGYAKD